MEVIDYEIQPEVEALSEAVQQRKALAAAAPRAVAVEAEELVCISSRALYSKYVDRVLWSGGVDEGTTVAVRETLAEGRACLEVDARCQKSVENRMREFEKFVVQARALRPAGQS